MRVNATYRSLLDKSIASMLSAIEIYNKPNFGYREEAFAILSVNAWELLFKARLLQNGRYNMRSIYQMEFIPKKDGTISKRKRPKSNRCGNPSSISIYEAIKRLKTDETLPTNLTESIESLIELRDNAIHFVNTQDVTKQIQELGFANIKNYISIIKKWSIEIDLSSYNFYLMPLAYVDSRMEADAILTSEVENYLSFIKSKIENQDSTDTDFDIAISIDIDFKKGSSFESLPFRYDPDGVPIALNDNDWRKRHPWSHAQLIEKCKERYTDFKYNNDFHRIMKGIKNNPKLHHSRKLDPDNKKSPVKPFYSPNVFKELDKHYTKH
jgi:hypothetical protein